MKHSKFIVLTCISIGLLLCYSQPSSNEPRRRRYEKIIHDYFGGWEKKNWTAVASQLGNGFTFTSPNNDDHISIEQFKEKCWVQAAHIKKFEFVKIIGNDTEAFALMHVITNDNKTIRNIEHFTFSNGKIKSIEVFFGGTGQGFPTNEK